MLSDNDASLSGRRIVASTLKNTKKIDYNLLNDPQSKSEGDN